MVDGWGMVRADTAFAVELRRQNRAIAGGATELEATGQRAQGPSAQRHDVGGGRTMTAAEIQAASGLGRAAVYHRIALGVTGADLLRSTRRGQRHPSRAPSTAAAARRGTFDPMTPTPSADWQAAVGMVGTLPAALRLDHAAGQVRGYGLILDVRLVYSKARDGSPRRGEGIKARRRGKPRWLFCTGWGMVETLMVGGG